MDDLLKTRLQRALLRQSPQHSQARLILASATTRDVHPTTGSEAIAALAAAGGPRVTTSLNTTRADGSTGKAFAFGVTGFGWGSGEWPGRARPFSWGITGFGWGDGSWDG